MRILYHHRIKSLDGQFVHIEEIVRELRSLGHEVRIVGPVSAESNRFGSESGVLAVIRRTLPRALYELLEFCYCFYDFFKLLAAGRKFRPDVVYERFNLFMPSGIWAKRLLGVPLVLEVNAPLLEERAAFGGLSLERLAAWTQGYAWRGADKVITVTSVLADIVAGYDVDRASIEVMPNGVDEEKFRYIEPDRRAMRRELGVENRFVIGFTGFVREWHRLDQVVTLLGEKGLAGAMLLIVGDGPARGSLLAEAARLGVADRLKVTGIVARADMPKHISTFDVALQANVVAYASPLKVLEYLAMGRAIVAPDSPNIRELLTHGENALLFQSGSIDGLRQALTALSGDANLRRRLETAARDTIGSRGLTWRRNALRVQELMAGLAAGESSRSPAG